VLAGSTGSTGRDPPACEAETGAGASSRRPGLLASTGSPNKNNWGSAHRAFREMGQQPGENGARNQRGCEEGTGPAVRAEGAALETEQMRGTLGNANGKRGFCEQTKYLIERLPADNGHQLY